MHDMVKMDHIYMLTYIYGIYGSYIYVNIYNLYIVGGTEGHAGIIHTSVYIHIHICTYINKHRYTSIDMDIDIYRIST